MVFDGSGIFLIAGLIIAIIHAVFVFGKSKTIWILVFIVYAFFIFLFTPAAADRHFIALLPLAAFAAVMQ